MFTNGMPVWAEILLGLFWVVVVVGFLLFVDKLTRKDK